ncbi:XRE family transcriptional regulator [Methanobacterium movens]
MREKNIIGAKIRNLRQEREMSMEELARASGNTRELIESIENGEIVTSLTPLIKIARALGVRLGTFMDDAPQKGPVVVKKGKSHQVIYFSGEEGQTKESALEFYSLGSPKSDRHMEPFLVDVDIHKEDSYKLSSHEGEEFIYVLNGHLELLYGHEKYQIKEGDSIYYDSVVPHHLHALGENKAKILAVVYTPF